MSEQEKKRKKIYDLLYTEPKRKQLQDNFLWLPSNTDITPAIDYVVWIVLENKTNATSLPNIRLLIEEEWNKMPEHFLKVCKSFRTCVDIIIEKMSFSFVVYFLKLKRILLYITKLFILL